MKYTPNELMHAHMQMNVGLYFSSISQFDDMAVGTSDTIDDFYWNYASPSSQVETITSSFIDKLTNQLACHDRAPALWLPDNVPPPKTWELRSTEAWMWLEPDDLIDDRETPPGASLVEHAVPTNSMCDVFHEAYSSGGSENDIGYFSLPPEYVLAYRDGRPQPSTIVRHFSCQVDSFCVAIGTAYVWNQIGGLYSVATPHNQRRRGYATYLSAAAAKWAIDIGAKGILLQTEADSPVEELYSSIGFHRSHLGRLLTPGEN